MELNKRWWYRAAKVLFIIVFVLVESYALFLATDVYDRGWHKQVYCSDGTSDTYYDYFAADAVAILYVCESMSKPDKYHYTSQVVYDNDSKKYYAAYTNSKKYGRAENEAHYTFPYAFGIFAVVFAVWSLGIALVFWFIARTFKYVVLGEGYFVSLRKLFHKIAKF